MIHRSEEEGGYGTADHARGSSDGSHTTAVLSLLWSWIFLLNACVPHNHQVTVIHLVYCLAGGCLIICDGGYPNIKIVLLKKNAIVNKYTHKE